MRKLLGYIGVLLSVVFMVGCEHKELCFEHPHLVPVRVDAVWDQFCEYPMGMTAVFFPHDGSESILVQSHTPERASVNLPVNRYDVLVFNETMAELGSINFRNMGRLETAEAYAYELHSRMRMKRAVDEPTVVDPERLGVALYRDYEVTEEMLERYRHRKEMNLPIEENVLTVYPKNVVYIVDVKVHVRGIYNVRSVESSLSGLSEGYLFVSGERTTPRVMHRLTNWHMVSTSATDRSEGYLHATCLSFGLPSDHTGESEENTLNLSVRLVDNETVLDFAFLVGDRIREGHTDCSPILYIEFGKPEIPDPDDPDDPTPDDPDDPTPDDPDDPTPDDPDKPDKPDSPGYDDPDIPIVFPDVKPEGTMDGGVSIDPSFDGDYSVEVKSTKMEKKADSNNKL